MNKTLEVQVVDLADLKPFEGNPRQHGDDIDSLVSSIRRFGWTNPILAQRSTGRIIAGHGRIEAARRAGLKVVPVIYLDLDDRDASAYTITDNRSAELSSWDFPKLKELIVQLDDGQFDLAVLGFAEKDLQSLIDFEKGAQPEPPEDESQTGDFIRCPKCRTKIKLPKRGGE